MFKRFFQINVMVVLLLLFLIPFAQAVPPVTSYWGNVTLDGVLQSNASVNVIDSSGNTVASATSNPNAQYAVVVYWDKLNTQTGASLTFKVNGLTTATQTIGAMGEDVKLDLTVTSLSTSTPFITSVTITPTTPFAGNEINLTIGINNPGASFTGRVEGNVWPPSSPGKYLGWETVVIPNGVSTVTITGAAGGDKSSYITRASGTHSYDVFLENVDAGEDYRNATDSRRNVAFTVGAAASVYMSNVTLSSAPTNGRVMTLNVTISNPTASVFTGTMNANIWDSAHGYTLTTQPISTAAGGSTTLTFSYTPVNHGLHSYDFFMVSSISGQNTKAPWGLACLDYLAGVGFTVG